jgi:type II secretory pathway pseudopilin PulG
MRRGLTLVELLVLVFVLVVAVAVLLGALESSYESARRAHCANAHQQITLALLNYEAAHKQFPGYRQELAGHEAGWGVMILPYIDEGDVWWNWEAGKPQKILLEVMLCPSDRPETLGPADGPCSYNVNTKVCMNGEGLSSDSIKSKDRTATTLLLGENLRVDKAHSWWDTDPLKVGFTVGHMQDNLRSHHGNGALVGWCNGRVSFLRDDIGDEVYVHIVDPDLEWQADESP